MIKVNSIFDNMKVVSALVLLSLVGCFVEGRSFRNGEEVDELTKLKKLVSYANQAVKENDLATVEMDDVDFNYVVFALSFMDNRVSGLDTLKLIGDNQHLNVTSDGKVTIYQFDVTIGFDKLKGHNSIFYSAGVSGRVKADIELTGEEARFVGTLQITSTGNKVDKIQLTLDKVELVNSGHYHITAKVTDNSYQFLANAFVQLGEIFMNHIYPWFRHSKRVSDNLANLANKVVNSKVFYQIITHGF